MRLLRRAGSVIAAALLILAGLIALGGFVDLFAKPNAPHSVRSRTPADENSGTNTLLTSGLFTWPPPWPIPTPTPEPLSATPEPQSEPVLPDESSPQAEVTPQPTEAPPVSAQQPPAEYQNYDMASAVIGYVNQARASQGLGALTPNGALAAAAEGYAQYLTDTNQFTHDANGGLLARIQAAGYGGGYAGEAIWEGWGNYASGDVVDEWLNSPPHREILLGAVYTDIGVGCYVIDDDGQPNTRCVLDVGAP
jgi:uncharacterized protein YkwD